MASRGEEDDLQQLAATEVDEPSQMEIMMSFGVMGWKLTPLGKNKPAIADGAA